MTRCGSCARATAPAPSGAGVSCLDLYGGKNRDHATHVSVSLERRTEGPHAAIRAGSVGCLGRVRLVVLFREVVRAYLGPEPAVAWDRAQPKPEPVLGDQAPLLHRLILYRERALPALPASRVRESLNGAGRGAPGAWGSHRTRVIA
jgi:hypothetical protein